MVRRNGVFSVFVVAPITEEKAACEIRAPCWQVLPAANCAPKVSLESLRSEREIRSAGDQGAKKLEWVGIIVL